MKKKGITLVALSITVLIMTILGSAAVGTVLGIVKLGRKDGYEATSRIVREQVEIIYKETISKKEIDESFEQAFKRFYVPTTLELAAPLPNDTIPSETLNLIANKYSLTTQELRTLPFYKVDTLESKKLLNIETSDLNFYVNFEKNIVFSTKPVTYNNKKVYTLEEIDDGFKIGSEHIDLAEVKIGDTIIYDPTKGVTNSSLLTYTSPVGSAKLGFNVSGNGSSSQTITATSLYNNYIVIDVVNGRLKLMSKDLVSISGSNFNIKGGQGYLFLEEELHKMCSVFGHGTGADKTVVTTYNIGNPLLSEEVKVKKIRDSGARSITTDDLKIMTTTDLEGEGNTNYPMGAVRVPTLQGDSDDGMSSFRRKNIPNNHKQTLSSSFVLKPKYASIGNANIFKQTYHLAGRSFQTTSSTGQFMCMGVEGSAIIGKEIVRGTGTEYLPYTISRQLRPIVFLSPDVKLKATSTANQWEVEQ